MCRERIPPRCRGMDQQSWASRNCTCRYPIAAPKQRCGPAPNGMKARFGRAATMSLSQNGIGLSGVVSLSGFGRSGFGEETDAGSGQQLGKRRCEIEVPVGWKLRFIGEGVNQPLRRVGDLPQGGRQ